MGKIHVLPEQVANQIAAGEVIERPASIVKELIENALDAAAAAIDIEIQHGGKSYLRVSDEGTGMDPQDARLAFQRHATSKIDSTEDLTAIASLGFRGEALASIAAVSRVRLITRPEGAASGTEVVVEGGRLLGVQEHACRRGTAVEVRDLFFNTPARRKFLRADSTELGEVIEVVGRLALSALAVRFTLKAAGRTVLDFQPTDQLKVRAAQMLQLESPEPLLEVDQEEGGIRVRGLIGKPSLHRGNRRQIHLFINRRWVKSLPLSYAVQEGFHGFLMEGRYPVAVVLVELDLDRVDVNVHPTKQEVRISGEPQLRDLVRRSVQRCLGQAGDLAPPLQLPAAARVFERHDALNQPGFSTETWRQLMKPLPAGLPQGQAGLPAGAAQTVPEQQEFSSGLPEEAPLCIRDSHRITRILGQLRRTFLLAETEAGFVVVDQHAAHERVVFEGLLRNLKNPQPERQMLFLEEVLELPLRHEELFKESLPLLSRLGFELELFGQHSWAIRAVPAVFGEVHPVQILQTFLEELEEKKGRTVLEEKPEALAALVACKKQSVKAQDFLEAHQIRGLLTSLARCENPFTCPHGRPVFFQQSFSDLERYFKRV